MLLLDTHAVLWLDNGDPLSAAAHEAIRQAVPSGGVLVSPVSAWEIGLLVSKGRLALDLEPVAWFRRFLRVVGIRLTPFTIEVAAPDARSCPNRSTATRRTGCWSRPRGNAMCLS